MSAYEHIQWSYNMYMHLWGNERNNPFGHLLIICANDRPLSGAVSMATTRLPYMPTSCRRVLVTLLQNAHKFSKVLLALIHMESMRRAGVDYASVV